MSQLAPNTSPNCDAVRSAILKSASPLRPTARTPDRSKCLPNVGLVVSHEATADVTAERHAQVNSELKELKSMYRKVVEAHRVLRADYRVCDEQRHAAEKRAEASEREVAANRPFDAVMSSDLAGLSEAAKLAKQETERLWKAIADDVEPLVLLMLRKQDAEARAAAEAEFEPQRRLTLWEALRESVDDATFTTIARNISGGTSQMAALPVSIARRLFEASEAPRSGEGTPRQAGAGTPRLSLGGTGAGAARAPRLSSSVPPPIPSAQRPSTGGHGQRLSTGGQVPAQRPSIGGQLPPQRSSIGGQQRRSSVVGTVCQQSEVSSTPARSRRDSASSNIGNGIEATPTSTFPGGVIVATPQSSSVRDRIRALETSGC